MLPAMNMVDIEAKALVDRAVAAYTGLAIGDAFGATVEFLSDTEIADKYTQHRDITGGGWLRLKPGQVTDDTAMSLVLGEAILSDRSINAFDIAQAFSDWMKSKPIDIGHTVRRGIMHFRYSDDPFVPESDSDAGNGACMRCLPIALATYGKDLAQVIRATRLQTRVTHNNKLSDAGTECIVLCIQDLLSGAAREDLMRGPVSRLVQHNPEFEFDSSTMDNPTGYIVHTLRAVFQAFFFTNSFEECLIDVVNRGGDTDTTGAIAGMLAGAYYGLQEIPPRWLKKMDSCILEQCQSQATSLIEKAAYITIDYVKYPSEG